MTYPKTTAADGYQPTNDQPSEPPKGPDFATSPPPKMGAGGFLPPVPPFTVVGRIARDIEVHTDIEPESDPGEPYDIDTVGALGEAASWARRWSTERQRADGLAAELERIDALHAPYIDEHGINRCRGCIAGYDPRTGQLTHCKYPCPTARARGGELPLL